MKRRRRNDIVVDERAAFDLEFVRRALRYDVGRAADRVAAIQRALGTTQHFDALGKEFRGADHIGLGCVETVDVVSHARIGTERVRHAADAANVDPIRIVGDRDARREFRDILCAEDAADRTILCRERRHRRGDIIQKLFAAVRGDNYSGFGLTFGHLGRWAIFGRLGGGIAVCLRALLRGDSLARSAGRYCQH